MFNIIAGDQAGICPGIEIFSDNRICATIQKALLGSRGRVTDSMDSQKQRVPNTLLSIKVPSTEQGKCWDIFVYGVRLETFIWVMTYPTERVDY
jgi:hypothetical protein